MELKLEITLLLFGGILAMLGTSVNVWYFITQTVDSLLIYYLCGLFIIAPSVIFLLLTIGVLLHDCCRGNWDVMPSKLGLGLLLAIGGPLGLPLFIYGIVLAIATPDEGDMFIIQGLSRASSLVEALFHSLPQVGLQFYNNQVNHSWSELKYCSICVSVLSIVYTCCKFCYALDQLQNYERTASPVKPEVVEGRTNIERRVDEELEIYNASEDQYE